MQLLGRLDCHGRAAQRAMAPVRPHRVVGARAPRAVGAALAMDTRVVPRHSHGGGRRGRGRGRGCGCCGRILALCLRSRAACAGMPRTGASSKWDAAMCAWGRGGTSAQTAERTHRQIGAQRQSWKGVAVAVSLTAAAEWCSKRELHIRRTERAPLPDGLRMLACLEPTSAPCTRGPIASTLVRRPPRTAPEQPLHTVLCLVRRGILTHARHRADADSPETAVGRLLVGHCIYFAVP